MATIGFIGLGHMGLPMAINLVKAGHQVRGFDLQPAAVEQLIAAGGSGVHALQDFGSDYSVLITMLQTGEQVQAVCLPPDGLYTTLPTTCLHIDCSTIDVNSAKTLHQQAANRQISMIDAPVSGGVAAAAAGTLTFMVGGEQAAFEQARPILSAMGKNIIHAGAAGSGQAAKLCNNMILGISMIGVSEAFILARQLGLSDQKLFEIVNNASGQCWVMSQYAPVPGVLPNVPANRDYQPGFTAAMMLKDLKLSQHSAEQTAAQTPLGALATRCYQQFIDQGFGNLDFSAIIQFIESMQAAHES